MNLQEKITDTTPLKKEYQKEYGSSISNSCVKNGVFYFEYEQKKHKLLIEKHYINPNIIIVKKNGFLNISLILT